MTTEEFIASLRGRQPLDADRLEQIDGFIAWRKRDGRPVTEEERGALARAKIDIQRGVIR